MATTTLSSTCDTTWSLWNYSYSDTNTTSSTAINDTWYLWNNTGTCNVTDGGTYTISNEDSWTVWVSQEEIEKDRKRMERAQHRIQAERAFPGGLTNREKTDLKQKKAEDKAKQLLLDLIGEEELKVYEETGRLFVKGNKYDYVVRRHGGVERIEKDKITDLCVHLKNSYSYPKTDNVIALKLAIEDDEDNVLKLANTHGSKDRPAILPKAACM